MCGHQDDTLVGSRLSLTILHVLMRNAYDRMAIVSFIIDLCLSLSLSPLLATLGHIAAVLGYCYHLCKHHIQKYLGSYQLLSLLGMLAGFLVQFFIKAKVYDWIASRGGWVSVPV